MSLFFLFESSPLRALYHGVIRWALAVPTSKPFMNVVLFFKFFFQEKFITFVHNSRSSFW